MKKLSFFSLILATGLLVSSFFSQFLPLTTAAALTEDDTLVNTWQSTNNVACAPTVVVDATDATILENVISAEEPPSNVILHINENMNIIANNGEVLDCFANVHSALDKRILPILYVETKEQADAVIDYLLYDMYILDAAVMSKSPELVNQIKTQVHSLRGIVEFDGTQSKEEMVKIATRNQAMTVVIPATFATTETVYYLQGMFKTVWVRMAGLETMQIANAVFSGSFGVIGSEAKPVYDFYKTLPKNTHVRNPFIVAHRTDMQNCHENSLSGIAASAEGGATHVEMDFHVTKDNRIVAMHDDTLNRTTNGSGTIRYMTLAEIQEYKIIDRASAEPEKIPTFEDCVREILKTNLIFVVEIKCEDLSIVGLIKDLLTKNADLAPILDQMVVISYYTTQLLEMKQQLPEVPTANLNKASLDTLAKVLDWMGLYNTGIDTSSEFMTLEFQEALKDRGIIDWTYTYPLFTYTEIAQWIGFVGLTTNTPSSFKDRVKFVSVADGYKGEGNVGEEINVTLTMYGGAVESAIGKIAYIDKKNNQAIASVQLDDYVFLTQAFSMNTVNSFGCNSSLMGMDGFAVAIVVLIVVINCYFDKKAKGFSFIRSTGNVGGKI